MLPPAAARDTLFKALVSYLVSAEDMVDPCGCVFRYIGGQVRFCARIMVRNVAAQMRSASQPHGCLTEHHPYPAGILLPILLLVVCLFFLKKGETLHELCLLLSRSAAEFRPNTQPTEQIKGRATKDASCAEHQREKSSKKTNNQQLRFHINPHRKQDNCVPPCRWLPSRPLTPLLYQQVAPVLVSSGVFFCFVF